jgi:hypothetical protein
VLGGQLGAPTLAHERESLRQFGGAGAVKSGAFLEHRILRADFRDKGVHGREE